MLDVTVRGKGRRVREVGVVQVEGRRVNLEKLRGESRGPWTVRLCGRPGRPRELPPRPPHPDHCSGRTALWTSPCCVHRWDRYRVCIMGNCGRF